MATNAGLNHVNKLTATAKPTPVKLAVAAIKTGTLIDTLESLLF